MVLEFLKNTHKFISDGYQKFTDLKKALGFNESDKEKALQQMIHQAGVQVDNVKHLHDEGGLSGLFRKVVGTDQFQHSLLGAVGEAVTAVTTEGITPKSVLALAQEGGKLFSRGFAETTADYRRGEWVLIDDGVEKIPQTIRNQLMWSEGEMFGEFPSSDEIDMETDHLVSIGFVTQVQGDGMLEVFNLEYGEAGEYRVNDLRHLESNRVSAMEGDKNIMAVKAFVMEPEKVAQRLACDVPCDPGEEIIYAGASYVVVSCNGEWVRIQNGEEIRKVRMDEVERGRVTHNNSWNYGGKTPTGFDRSVEASLHKGMWVWLPTRLTTSSLPAPSRS